MSSAREGEINCRQRVLVTEQGQATTDRRRSPGVEHNRISVPGTQHRAWDDNGLKADWICSQGQSEDECDHARVPATGSLHGAENSR